MYNRLVLNLRKQQFGWKNLQMQALAEEGTRPQGGNATMGTGDAGQKKRKGTTGGTVTFSTRKDIFRRRFRRRLFIMIN